MTIFDFSSDFRTRTADILWENLEGYMTDR